MLSLSQVFGGQGLAFIVAIGVMTALLVLRNRRPRALRIERLWIRPAIFLAIMATTLYAAPPPTSAASIAVLAAGLILGGCLGWLRGAAMRIEVHPETHDVTAVATPLAMIFILVLVVARMAMRGAAFQNASMVGVPGVAIVDALVLMAVGMMAVQGLEMWLRARRLLAEAQAAKALARRGDRPIVR